MNSMIPGLLDDNKEFFDHKGQKHCASSGSVISLEKLPEDFSGLIGQVISSDKALQRALESWGIVNEEEKLLKYYKCNYSACNELPDISAAGELGPREYVPCSERGSCKNEGTFCQIPLGLTKKERDVVREIGLGSFDKEICSKLNIRQNTLRKHKDHASAKAGIERKTSLGILAHKLRLIDI